MFIVGPTICLYVDGVNKKGKIKFPNGLESVQNTLKEWEGKQLVLMPQDMYDSLQSMKEIYDSFEQLYNSIKSVHDSLELKEK